MGTGAVEVVSAEAIRGGGVNRRIRGEGWGRRVAGAAASYILTPTHLINLYPPHVLSAPCHRGALTSGRPTQSAVSRAIRCSAQEGQ